MDEKVLVPIFLGSLIGPVSILVLVTLIVHDLDGGLLLFLGIITAPFITIFTFGILYLASRQAHSHASKIS
tara:strand:+ start:164 stop:376 length:213 start_codon:yes stop_codon:yes gene_type:complete